MKSIFLSIFPSKPYVTKESTIEIVKKYTRIKSHTIVARGAFVVFMVACMSLWPLKLIMYLPSVLLMCY